MNDPIVTFSGWVGDVTTRQTEAGPVANLRVGVTPRVRRGEEWVDGSTSWFRVTCWRRLAENVRDSVQRGDPVVVHGRVRATTWTRPDGTTSNGMEVEALHLGHDLSRGRAVFDRQTRRGAAEAASPPSGDAAHPVGPPLVEAAPTAVA